MHNHSGLPLKARSPASRREVLFAAASLFSAGQFLPAQPDAGRSVVPVLATVRDAEGQLVRGLTKDDFLLEEDGRPQAIQSFQQDGSQPFTLGLLINANLSLKLVTTEQKRATYQFLNEVFRPNVDSAFLIRFDREIEAVQELTSSRAKLDAALDVLEKFRARTKPVHTASGPNVFRSGSELLYDAVQVAADAQMKTQKGRKALILLSDGVDTGSKILLSDSMEAVQRTDTLIYSLYFADEQALTGGVPTSTWGGSRRSGPSRSLLPLLPGGKKTLERLSKETGGRFFDISQEHPLEEALQQMSEEVRGWYSLGFVSDRPEGSPGYRKLRLTAKPAGLAVRTRAGYYADR